MCWVRKKSEPIDPLLASRFPVGRAVAVGGKCRLIRLLSGAVPLCAPTVKLPQKTVIVDTSK